MEGMKGVNVRDELIDEIMSSPNSAVIAYHLAQNPDKLNALNSMSGRELAREMGRLEATVKLPEAKKATTAPAPFSRPKGGAAPSSMEADLRAISTRNTDHLAARRAREPFHKERLQWLTLPSMPASSRKRRWVSSKTNSSWRMRFTAAMRRVRQEDQRLYGR
jgi:hypothetical protein